ncbi:MAG: choice-of-anchor D domain-containing protein, partial [Alphaproteobacteria bacterium]|nr:choice-of-anchor D domain-containing protein [Alphaproteobacteria bacterium]
GKLNAHAAQGVFAITQNFTSYNGTFTIAPLTFSNQGTITVSNGDTVSIEPTAFANLSGTTLNGGVDGLGAYVVDTGSTLILTQSGTVATLDAALTLSGANSVVKNGAGVTIDSTLVKVGNGGDLDLAGQRNFTDPHDLTVAAKLQLGGGTLQTGTGAGDKTALAIAAGGMLSGFGTVANQISNAGAITASGGTLTLTGPVNGAGGLAVAGGADLEIGGATGETVSFEDAAGALRLDDPSGFTSTIGFSHLAIGDVVDLANTTTGSATFNRIESLLNQAIAAQGANLAVSSQSDGSGGAEFLVGHGTQVDQAVPKILTANPLSLPNVHVNSLDGQTIAIQNAAISPATALDANVAQVSGTNFIASGSFTGLQAGQVNNTALTVGLQTGTAGHFTGAVVLDFSSENTGGGTTTLPSQTLNVAGSVYRLAKPSVGTLPQKIFHVGDGGGQVKEALTIGNQDPNDGFSENLQTTIGQPSGGVSFSGSPAEIAPGGSTNNISVVISTGHAGTISGSVPLSFASDGGTGGGSIDGLGQSADGTQNAIVNAVVDNFADPIFKQVTGIGGYQQGLGPPHGQNGPIPVNYEFDFGDIVQYGPPASVHLAVANAAAGPADLLSGNFTITDDAPMPLFGNTGFNTPVSGLGAGQQQGGLTVTLNPNTVGTYVEFVTLKPTGSNAGGYSQPLSPVTVEITANIIQGPPVESPAALAAEPIHFGNVHTEYPGQPWPMGPNANATQNVAITNGGDDNAAGLDVQIAGSTGPATFAGAVNDLGSGNTSGPASPAGAITGTIPYPAQPGNNGLAVGPVNGTVTLAGQTHFHSALGTVPADNSPLTLNYDGTLIAYSDPLIAYTTSVNHTTG